MQVGDEGARDHDRRLLESRHAHDSDASDLPIHAPQNLAGHDPVEELAHVHLGRVDLRQVVRVPEVARPLEAVERDSVAVVEQTLGLVGGG